MPHHLAQCIGRELRVPRAMRLVVIAQHADQVMRQRRRIQRLAGLVRAELLACLGNVEMAVIHLVAGAEIRFGDMQGQRGLVLPCSCVSFRPVGHMVLSR